MKPGERIASIKAATGALENQDWQDIDLTLGQFGFATSEDWRGDKHGYLIEMLQHGDDQKLVDLNDYLFPQEEASPAPAVEEVEQDGDSVWKTGNYRLFLSHVSTQKSNMSKLAKALEQHAIEAFVAHDTIDFGAEWESAIREALRSCDGLAAWLTSTFCESSWCDQEVGFAVALDKMVVPLRFGKDPYGFIGHIQGLAIRPKHPVPEIARSIFDLLVRHPRSRDRMAEVLVARYENSGSFDAVRTNVGYLRMIPTEAWTQVLKEQTRTASERNGQISSAWVGSEDAPVVVNRLLDAL